MLHWLYQSDNSKSAAIAALFVFMGPLKSGPRSARKLSTSPKISSLWGSLVGFSKETIESELQHVAKLQRKNLGELAELAFMRKAASLGLSVANLGQKAKDTTSSSAPTKSAGAFR